MMHSTSRALGNGLTQLAPYILRLECCNPLSIRQQCELIYCAQTIEEKSWAQMNKNTLTRAGDRQLPGQDG